MAQTTGNRVLDSLDPLTRAARIVGGFSELARKISTSEHTVSRQLLQKWHINGHVPPPKRSKDPNFRTRIARASGGAVKASELEEFDPTIGASRGARPALRPD